MNKAGRKILLLTRSQLCKKWMHRELLVIKAPKFNSSRFGGSRTIGMLFHSFYNFSTVSIYNFQNYEKENLFLPKGVFSTITCLCHDNMSITHSPPAKQQR